MSNLFLLLCLFLLIIASFFLWQKIEYTWLNNICKLLVISLPFERIPSLDIAGVTVRISQILVLVGFWFLILLILKKDPTLMSKRILSWNWLFLLFIILSIPSWFYIVNFSRFLTTWIAVLLAFGASFLLANFSENIWQRLKDLTITMFFVGLFAYYQFIGDLLGLPPSLTGLRMHYTKIVFGYPRLQSTALEPLYFAGMLFLPLFFCFSNIIISQKKLWNFQSNLVTLKTIAQKTFSKTDPVQIENKSKKGLSFIFKFIQTASLRQKIDQIIKQPQFLNFFLLFFFLNLLFLTLSKAGILIFLFNLFIFSFFLSQKFNLTNVFKNIGIFAFILIFLLILGSLSSPKFNQIIQKTLQHFLETFQGLAPTARERLLFLDLALKIQPEYIFTGIGAGQYGVWVNKILDRISEEYLIVNNVYLEVWLEYGFLAFLTFLILLFSPLQKAWQKLQQLKQKDFLSKKIQDKKENLENINLLESDENLLEKYLTTWVLLASLSSYFLQWLTFSPIYIMPIFILLGLMVKNLDY